jgi:rare lipoprotein A
LLLLATTPKGVYAAIATGSEVAVSFYGNGGQHECGKNRPCQGAQTACGQMFNMYKVSVAHKTLACGTAVRFCYEGKCLVAPVTDRGPYVKGRSFDLSLGAAKRLGITKNGVTRLKVAVLTR